MSTYLSLSIIHMGQCNTNTQTALVKNTWEPTVEVWRRATTLHRHLTTLFLRADDISETFFWIIQNRKISQCCYNRRRRQHTHIHTYIGMNVHACNYWHVDLNEDYAHVLRKNSMMKATPEKMWSHHQKFQHLMKFLLTSLINVVNFLIYHRM